MERNEWLATLPYSRNTPFFWTFCNGQFCHRCFTSNLPSLNGALCFQDISWTPCTTRVTVIESGLSFYASWGRAIILWLLIPSHVFPPLLNQSNPVPRSVYGTKRFQRITCRNLIWNSGVMWIRNSCSSKPFNMVTKLSRASPQFTIDRSKVISYPHIYLSTRTPSHKVRTISNMLMNKKFQSLYFFFA